MPARPASCCAARQPDRAFEAYRRALELFVGCGAHSEVASTKTQLGAAYMERGDFATALDLYVEAERAWRELADETGLAWVELFRRGVYVAARLCQCGGAAGVGPEPGREVAKSVHAGVVPARDRPSSRAPGEVVGGASGFPPGGRTAAIHEAGRRRRCCGDRSGPAPADSPEVAAAQRLDLTRKSARRPATHAQTRCVACRRSGRQPRGGVSG